MKKKIDKSTDENIYDINNKLIKHNDIVKILKNRENFKRYKEGGFYRVDSKHFGILCLINNESGTDCPISEMDADFEIQ